MPAFEDEAFGENVDFGGLAQTSKGKSKGKSKEASSSPTDKGRKPLRSDGISNHSHKIASQGLSIPSEFVQEEEADVSYQSSEPEQRQERQERQEQQVSHKTYLMEQKEMEDKEPPPQPMSSLPWYLQPQHQRPVSTDPDGPMAERQKLPDLPLHPPKNLEAIMQHLSVEIGLDYLTILDLRVLDPPPALGNNLLMLIGTARSEKHLDIGASRFCAYLRREYGFRPYADGLLGRNELKIKQKRKAKKARALANAGARGDALAALDDGIRTGWVCVHAGYLDPHPQAELKDVKRMDGMVGFGEENNKVTLVVQMFTEERRESVGLEELWRDILERNLKKQRHRLEAAPVMADVDGEVPKAGDVVEEDDTLTAKELKARKRFKLGSNTVLDGIHDWEPQDTVAPPNAQAV
jgi:hypothetical protein